MAELEEERRWDESFARSPDGLAKLAAEAMAEHRTGKTQELDPSGTRRSAFAGRGGMEALRYNLRRNAWSI